jgi:hypothetical protein
MPATGSIQRLAERYIYCTFLFHRYLLQTFIRQIIYHAGKRGIKQAIATTFELNTGQIIYKQPAINALFT